MRGYCVSMDSATLILMLVDHYYVHTLLCIFIPADLGATETDAMLCSGYWSRRCSRSRDPSPEPLRQRGKRREHCQSYGKDHKEHQKEEEPLMYIEGYLL